MRNNFYNHELLFVAGCAIISNMDDLKQRIMQHARALGIDDIRFADAQGALSHKQGTPVALQACLPGAASLIVLFFAYRPGGAAPAGYMPLSAYYPAAHFGYHAARALAAHIAELGASAVHLPSLPARAAALRTGGFIGDNGFYYHPTLGSLTCIQTILTDAALPPDEMQTVGGCLHCRKCVQACPSGAVEHMDNCLRSHLNGLVPENLRSDAYQLFGCEKCQTACPLNRFEAKEPLSFPVDALLSGSALPDLKRLAGPNMSRRMRVASQAALFAANTGQRQLVPLLAQMAQSGNDPAGTHAAWALSRLNSEVNP
jgi:epoxyqueuosine reductase QueG